MKLERHLARPTECFGRLDGFSRNVVAPPVARKRFCGKREFCKWGEQRATRRRFPPGHRHRNNNVNAPAPQRNRRRLKVKAFRAGKRNALQFLRKSRLSPIIPRASPGKRSTTLRQPRRTTSRRTTGP